MIKFCFLISLFLLYSCTNHPINWNLKSVGTLEKENSAGAIDFIFLSPTSILVANFPKEGSATAPLQIYTKVGDKWIFDSIASQHLPPVYHARQMILDDIDGDNIPEVVIADHGLDSPPFPGGHLVILKEKNGKWENVSSAQSLGSDFTFNAAVVTQPDGAKAIYKANVFGKTPFFYSFKNGKWVDQSSSLPNELQPGHICLMTALSADFNQDGIKDLFLGGCDLPNAREDHIHDRILFLNNKEWTLASVDSFSARPKDSSWGTVFSKLTDWNGDAKPDILFASHDFGFHTWEVGVYVNQSVDHNFKFNYVRIPISPERNTEGYIHSLEDFDIPGLGHAYLGEFRSIIRSKDKKLPSSFARLALKTEKKITDESDSLPEEIKRTLFRASKIPGSQNELLIVPYHGNIYSVKPVKN